jgi:hypothetical protein
VNNIASVFQAYVLNNGAKERYFKKQIAKNGDVFWGVHPEHIAQVCSKIRKMNPEIKIEYLHIDNIDYD